MGTWFKRAAADGGGFTLIQMLIILAILVILAGISAPNLRGLVGAGKPEAARAELTNVQNALQALISRDHLTPVPTVTTATNDMTAFPDAKNPLFPDYFFISRSKGTYTCDDTGKVTQVTTGY